LPATIGIITPSDSMAMIALSEMIERRFSIVGNVSGSRMLNITASSTVRMTRP
jgi:hypothetical protein